MIAATTPRPEGLTVRTQTDRLQALGTIHPMAPDSLYLLTLAAGDRLIHKHLISAGAISDQALQDILRYALYDRAKAITLLRHRTQHQPEPTARERGLIRELQGLCQTLRIQIDDCLLVGADQTYSWTEEGDLQYDDMPF